jgi:lipid A ethanolaminephosphotransferase
MSDHGESLGENGIYLHGLPYSIAPKQQTQVPFFVWLSDNYKKDHPQIDRCFSEQSKKPAHHDNLFHTVLGMFDIKTSAYQRSFDLTEKCHG